MSTSIYDHVIFQWTAGERRLRQAPPQRSALLESITEALVAELRRRLGGRFYIQELVDLYGRGTAWCLVLAMNIAPDDPWAWDSMTVVDAAFGRYVRAAADYGGGRRPASQ